MQVAFRTDASLEIGTGHVMRCLTLADALRERGAACRFVCRELPGNLIAEIRQRGYQAHVLPSPTTAYYRPAAAPAHAAWLGVTPALDAEQTLAALGAGVDWLVLDHYAVDAGWESLLRPACQRLLVIDDLAERPHLADLLLDQNLGRRAADYEALLPAGCRRLIGPAHALLRPEFAARRAASLARRQAGKLRQVLVSMGGIDKDNATGAVLAALPLGLLPGDCRIIVVMGAHAPWRDAVAAQVADLPWPAEMRVSVADMAMLIADSDLAIGAAGTSAWERCCLGLPSLTAVLAANQQSGAAALQAAGCVELIGKTASGFEDLPEKLAVVLAPGRLVAMQAACAALTDGLGASRLAVEMMHA
ncbi:MAG: UDP-2,4-diacetamido-2,4, 6-trideoxy-beta-L-altropy ranose hydrolase [Pseudomonadota bacterium]